MAKLIRTEHAISAAVWRRRGYKRWEPDDPDPVRKAFSSLQLPGQRGQMTRDAGKTGGWLIPRHAPPDMDLAEILAEVRPDDPWKGRRICHVHPTKRSRCDAISTSTRHG